VTTSSDDQQLDDETFAAFQAGSDSAASRLVDLYHLRLFHFALQKAGSREAAEDAVQEAFIELYRQRAAIEAPGKVLPWLFTLVRRRIARQYERGPREITLADGEDHPDGESPAAQRGGILGTQAAKWIDRALAGADDKDREMIILKYFCGMKIREIAAVLAMPQGTVGVRIARGLQRLRAWFDDEGISPEDLLDG
jgi:RNA polymerase sigma-70 factor (ECF subfamily)